MCRAGCKTRKIQSRKVQVFSSRCQRLSHANSVGIEPETTRIEEQVPRDRIGLEMLRSSRREVDLSRMLTL